MFESNQSILEFLDRVLDGGVYDFADQYGEPGYGSVLSEDRLIVLGTYWCRCEKFVVCTVCHDSITRDRGVWVDSTGGDVCMDNDGVDGTHTPDDANPLHDVAVHYPHAFRKLEDLGVHFEWYDEWIVTHDGTSKAWRTSADSYSWQPSYVITDDGEIITTDDDVEEWIAWAANDSSRCIMSTVADGSDLEDLGFEKYNGQFENGWHPGQTDDPREILERIDDLHGPDVDVVFALDETSQFYMRFSAYYRSTSED